MMNLKLANANAPPRCGRSELMELELECEVAQLHICERALAVPSTHEPEISHKQV